MNRKAWLACLAGVSLAVSQASASVVLFDDFDGDSLDLSKWQVVTGTGGSIVQENGHVTTNYGPGRSYLVTVEQWNPADGALVITGRTSSLPDSFVITSRATPTLDSAGLPNDGGVLGGGLMAMYWRNGELLTILEKTDAVWPWVEVVSPAIVPNSGDATLWDFTYIDDGFNISITVTNVANPGNTVTHTATSSISSGFYHVAITNVNGGFDYIQISQVPEPASMALVGIGAMFMLCRSRRSQG